MQHSLTLAVCRVWYLGTVLTLRCDGSRDRCACRAEVTVACSAAGLGSGGGAPQAAEVHPAVPFRHCGRAEAPGRPAGLSARSRARCPVRLPVQARAAPLWTVVRFTLGKQAGICPPYALHIRRPALCPTAQLNRVQAKMQSSLLKAMLDATTAKLPPRRIYSHLRWIEIYKFTMLSYISLRAVCTLRLTC